MPVLLIGLLLCGARAQERLALSHQAWSTEEGLPDASVHGILQSRDGYLWLATEGGAARFDGVEFKVYRRDNEPAFASNDVSAVMQDSSGTIWFGTADGLVSLQGTQFRRFDERNGLPSSRIVALTLAADHSLLVHTGSGTVRWDGAGFRATELAGQLEPGIETLKVTQGRNAWTYTGQAVQVAGAKGVRTFEVGHALPGSRVTALLVDPRGLGWVGTNHGLALLDPETGSVRVIEALRTDSILCLAQDREGDLWVGTESSGLHVLRPRKFSTEAATAGVGITAVVAPEADLAWFGTRDNGLFRLRESVATQPVPMSALASRLVLSLATGRRGDLWVGTPDGLNHVQGAQVDTLTSADGLPDDFVRSVLEDQHGVVWAGTRRGLARVDHGRVTVITRGEGLGSDSIGPIGLAHDSGTTAGTGADELWVGTSDGLSQLAEGRIQTFRPPATAGPAIVTALAATGPDEVLFSTHGQGLFLLRSGAVLPIRSTALPAELTQITPDHVGFVWMRGLQSVYRVSMEQVRSCARDGKRCSLPVAAMGAADGLPANAPELEGSPQMSLGPNGSLWVGTRRGLGVADTAALPWNSVPPPVVIQRFSVDGDEQPVGATSLKLAAGHSRYAFSFVALSYALPSKVRYRYKLDGLDRDWIPAGNLRAADYTSLPAGWYRFRVQAENNDGVWNSTGAELSFRVLPPLYRRPWFAALVIVVLLGLGYVAIRLRERAVQRRFALVLQERNRMAREVHDTLAQDFVSVSLQLEITSSLLKMQQTEGALRQLQDTRQLVKEGLQAARQSIWNLRASAGEDSLPTRLSALVGRYKFQGKPARLTMGGAFRKLAPALEAEVLRIAGEALSNAERHADTSEVNVELAYGQDELVLRVQDSGKGFVLAEAERKVGHYGLRGIAERSTALRGKLTISSRPGEGTTVHLVVPL